MSKIHALVKLAGKLPVVRWLLRPLTKLLEERNNLREQLRAFGGFVPPGHFYSTVPNREEVVRALAWGRNLSPPLGIDLNIDGQVDLLEELRHFYGTIPFPEQPAPDFRYHFQNEAYSYSDAIYLHILMRHRRPRRVIEVGSGYSSSVMLDTNALFFQNSILLTFIDPHPEVLLTFIRPEDRLHCTIRKEKVQDTPSAVFEELQEGDMLFVDSSHVIKAGSDVHREIFDILPRLKRGVLVHFHDIFDGFEYPEDWFEEGRAWNEQYLLRAFLQYNTSFRILLFGNLLARVKQDWLARHMPFCIKNPGGSIWLEKMT